MNETIKGIDYSKIALYGILSVALIVLIFSAISTSRLVLFQQTPVSDNSMQKISKMSLTAYDKQLAIQFMDKDMDGKCDACGMPVEMCMSSGQMQCNMDSESTIGILGSQHVHADFKVFLNGKAINFASKDYYMKSSFIHADNNQNKEDASGVLHMHATGVPLWIFFESIGLEFPNGMKTYVNGKLIQDYKNYVFIDLDKILITDGVGDLNEHLNSVTDFAKNH